jgi:peptidoglycan/LPS O-acetylase OafA/YrhL
MKLTYRPEIDGLRAIAVGAVILYHAQITIFGHQLLTGGFIGVDIFFVISGYLITSIILKELLTTGSFSFKHFFERRVRRILPALLFLMLVSLSFAWMYLLPSSFVDFSKSILYSLGFSSNFYFWYSGQQYGAEDGLLKPFLHTWSLSVEEQYYIIFPIVLLITFKYFRKSIIHILILGFIISLGLADWGSKNHTLFNFYVLPTRVWELLAGSILAYFEITKGHRSKHQALNLILPTTGLLLIGHSILFFNDEMFHPSFYTLSPIIGVCLIIWFSHKNEVVTKILSNKIFVFFGLISYSLYLFHYPMFAFSRLLEIFNDYYKFIFIFLAIIVSIFSYYFIERPFRDRKIISLKKLIIILLSSIIFILSFNLNIIKENGIKSRLPEIFQEELTNKNIKFHQKENLQKVVLIGDSHSRSLEYHLNEELKKNNFSFFRFYTLIYLKNFNLIDGKTKKINKTFVENNNKIDKFLIDNSKLIIIFHKRWSVRLLETLFDNEEGYKEYLIEEGKDNVDYFEPIGIKTSSQQQREKYIREGIISEINNIINLGHKLILVYPVPEMAFHSPKLLYSKYVKSFMFNKKEYSPSILTGSYEVYKKRNKLIFEILDSVKNENIYRVYPHSYFCNKQIKNRCVANNENNIFYYDDDHLSLQGSKLVVDEIIKEIQKIELKSN